MKKILLGLLVFILAVAGSGYYLLQDKIAASGPDDSKFYNFKLISEWIQLKLPASDQEKVALKLQFMQERLNELTDLERTKTSPKRTSPKSRKAITTSRMT